MAFPNSHAFAFAQLPRGMTKTWHKETLTDNLKPVQSVPNVMKHRHSSISKIQLSIEFDQIANFMASECNGADDENDDAIELWKENRNLWRDLEKCVEEQIDRYVKSIHANIQTTLNAKSFTFETPTRKRTEIIRSDLHHLGTGQEHCNNTAPDAQTVLTLPDDSRIGPDDSASVLGENYMRQTIDREVENAIRQASDRLSKTLIDAQARKKKSKKHQKHSQRTGSSMFARSVLNYAKT